MNFKGLLKKAKVKAGEYKVKAAEYQAKAPARRDARIAQLQQEVKITKLQKQKRKLTETQGSGNSYGSGLNKLL